jgi:ribonuclease-3 family protein
VAEGFPHGMLPGCLELAYLGDAIYDLAVREALVKRGGHVRDMHRAAVARVCAHAQAQALLRVEGILTEDEQAVVRRGRNAHQSPPKNADRAEYHRATGLEALIGYLYITGRTARMREILDAAMGDFDEG